MPAVAAVDGLRGESDSAEWGRVFGHSDVQPVTELGDGDQWRRRCRCGTSDDGPVGGDHLHRHYSFIGVEQGGIDALGALGHHLGCDLGDPRRCCGVDAGHIVWYTTAASPAAAPTSATNTTVAATNADRADTPQFDVSLLAMAGTSPSRSCRARHTAGARAGSRTGVCPWCSQRARGAHGGDNAARRGHR